MPLLMLVLERKETTSNSVTWKEEVRKTLPYFPLKNMSESEDLQTFPLLVCSIWFCSKLNKVNSLEAAREKEKERS